MQDYYWIIMGDIIKSRKTNGQIIAGIFEKLVTYLNEKFRNEILSPLTITLGDEFQGVLQSQKTGIKIILEAEEWLLNENDKIEIRFALNYGQIETEINKKIAHGMLGQGLTETRELLNLLKNKKDRFWVGKSGKPDKRITNLFILLQSLTAHWKNDQRKIAASFLKYKDYKIVATNMGKDISLLWRREKSLKMREYELIKQLLLMEIQ